MFSKRIKKKYFPDTHSYLNLCDMVMQIEMELNARVEEKYRQSHQSDFEI